MGHKLLMISGDRALAEGKHGAFYNTLEEFHKYWERIDVITPRPAGGNRAAISTLFRNVFIHSSGGSLISQPWYILRTGIKLFTLHKFDLMLVHEYPPFYNGFGAIMLWNKIRTPYVLEILHVPGYPVAANIKESFYKALLRNFIKFDAEHAVAVRVINQKQTPEFLISAGLGREKIVYIPAFYIDLDTFKPASVPKKYDLVFAARLEKNKGILKLIRALKFVKIKLPSVKLLIVGNGPLKKKLKSFVDDNNLESNVFFSGWLETARDVAKAYNSVKIFINPSLNEGGPRVALEAMACGLPVITTRVGVMLDVIRDGENGLFTGWDPNEMAEKILYLVNNQELQDKFSAAGLEMVKQFEKSTAIKNFADKLKSLL